MIKRGKTPVFINFGFASNIFGVNSVRSFTTTRERSRETKAITSYHGYSEYIEGEKKKHLIKEDNNIESKTSLRTHSPLSTISRTLLP